MKLLQNSWSDMLILDHMHQRLHNHLPDETTLPNGQKFDMLSLALLGTSNDPVQKERFNELSAKLQELKFDLSDYVCLKFLSLLNPGTVLCVRRVRVRDASSMRCVSPVLLFFVYSSTLVFMEFFFVGPTDYRCECVPK
jgi:nuclear receptor subfamily 5 group A protein 3